MVVIVMVVIVRIVRFQLVFYTVLCCLLCSKENGFFTSLIVHVHVNGVDIGGWACLDYMISLSGKGLSSTSLKC